jgi:flagellar biosynthesis/type III secretory pathway M-ring protein FliF/YscJ
MDARKTSIPTTDGMEAIPVFQRLRDAIQDVLRRIGGMDTSARLLVGSILVILTMGLFLVSQYAASPAMSSVTVKPEDAMVVLQTIRDHGYTAEDAGNGSILVEARNKAAIRKYVEEAGYSIESVSDADLEQSGGQWVSNAEREQMQRTIRIRRAERAIGMDPKIKDVSIVLSGGGRTQLGLKGPKPRAAVTVELRTGSLDREMAETIAMQALIEDGLELANVTVVEAGGTSFRFGDESGGGRRDYLAQMRAFEREVSQKLGVIVRAAFPQASVAVNAQVLVAEIDEESVAFEKPAKGDSYVATDESETPIPGAGGGQPGFRSNAGVSGVGAASLGGGSAIAKRSTSENVIDNRFPGTRTRTREFANHPVKIAATVLLPTQAVESILRQELGEEAEIGQAQIDARVDAVRTLLQQSLTPLVDSSEFRDGTTGEVVVQALPFAEYMPIATAGIGGGVGDMIQGVTGGDTLQALKNAGLVGLSLLSLAMMFMMVRRSGGGDVLPSAEELAGVPPVLEDDEAEVVGEADEAAPALVGVELDDEELRRKQMLEQLNQLVKKDPADVAALLRRWMRTES